MSTRVGASAASELWRHAEQRGYYTRLSPAATSVLAELGLDHAGSDMFGAPEVSPLASHTPPKRPWSLSRPIQEGYLYDCIELFRGSGNWSLAHEQQGLTIHAGLDSCAGRGLRADITSPSVARELIGMAARRIIGEWHAGVPCVSFGSLRRPRVRSRLYPSGFNPTEAFTAKHNSIARITACILTVAVLCGQYISVEQPAGSCLYWMHCFRVLAQTGRVLTTFCFCSYGSPFLKRSTWLHNKSWVAKLQGNCSCQWAGNHFPVRNGSFTTESLSVFLQRCVPNCISVYGFEPVVGDCVSGAYPKALALRRASGSLATRAGHWEPLPSSAVELTCRKLNLEAVSTQLPLPAEHEPYPPRGIGSKTRNGFMRFVPVFSLENFFATSFVTPGTLMSTRRESLRAGLSQWPKPRVLSAPWRFLGSQLALPPKEGHLASLFLGFLVGPSVTF